MNPTTPPPVRKAERLLAALPAIYAEDPFLGALLAPFERMLLRGGEEEDLPGGLEDAIDRIHELFDPGRTPEHFLPWLATWVGMEDMEALDITVRRRLIAAAVELARSRGTREGLRRVLELTTGGQARVTEPSGPDFQIGVHSTIGIDTCLEGPDVRCFHVELSLPVEAGGEAGEADADENGTDTSERVRRGEMLARRIIERERPAHTFYTLTVSSPGEE